MISVSDILGNAASEVKGGLGSALNQATSGDIAGAVTTIVDTASGLGAGLSNQSGAGYGDDFAGMQAREDAMQSWCWYAIMPLIVNQNTVAVASMNPTASLPWYYVEDAQLPQRQIESKTVDRNGHSVSYAESYRVDGLSLTLFMDNANKAHNYLKAWQALIVGNTDPTKQNNQGIWGFPAQYKKDITIVVTSVTKKKLLSFKYTGCYPTNLDQLQLDSGQSNRLKQQVSFNCDDVGVTVMNLNGPLQNLISTATGYGLTALNGMSTQVIAGALSAAGSIF